MAKKKMRNGFVVFDQIKAALPTSELRCKLSVLGHKIRYKPPEGYFAYLNFFVNDVISHPPKEDWEWEIVSILTTKSIETLKEEEMNRMLDVQVLRDLAREKFKKEIEEE